MSAVVNHASYHRSASLWMIGGSLLMIVVLLLMNQFGDTPKRTKAVASTQFEIKKQPKPKPKVKERVKKKIKPRVTPPSPVLDLNANISGLDLGLAAFSLDEVGVDDSLLGDTSNAVLTSDLVDSVPQPRFTTPVEYPRRALAKEIEGYVVLSLLINKEGKVEKVKVIESDPAGVFEDKAVQTVTNWVFEPARYKGEVVKTWANQTIRFELG